MEVVERGHAHPLVLDESVVDLDSLQELPLGTVFDTTKGQVTLTSAALIDYQVNNRRLGEALAVAFTNAGGRLHENTPVAAWA